MKCRPIQKLIPLYVEGDLPRRKAERVREHVDECLPCRGLAEGYRASQRWLHTSPAPTPTGAALEKMRQAVWRQIQAEPPRSALVLWFERGLADLRRWANQPGVAVATVCLVVLGSVSLSRIRGPEGHRGSDGAGLAASDDPFGDDSSDEPSTSPGADESALLLAQATRGNVSEAEAVGDPEADERAADDSAMRIEIQTRDPDVRIIWFTPPEDQNRVED